MSTKRRHHSPNSTGFAAPAAPRGNNGDYWLYGWHAVQAALANPERAIRRLLVSDAAASRLKLPRAGLPQPQTVSARELDQLLGGEAVHQGIAALVTPLPGFVLEDVLHLPDPAGPLLILDQVSDPHNVGAILRSAAAFEAVGMICPKDHSAPESAVMAKAACGGLDIVPRITVTNLANAMRELQQNGWWIIGLEGEASADLTGIPSGGKNVLVLGAEGRGMRRLTAELCDHRVRLPMGPRMESLNVSNAAAIALYQLYASRHATA